MSKAPRIILRPNLGISTEQARVARSRAWLYVFECFNNHREGQEGSPTPATLDNDGTRIKGNSANARSLSE